MGEEILKTDLKREAGFLYYVGTDEDGTLTVCRAVMARHGRTKKKSKKK